MMKKCDRPHVGVGVIIERNDNTEVLLMKRKNSHGEGSWSFPGGKLMKFETFDDCAIRETKEETNLDIFDIELDKFCSITNDFFEKENLHYITIYIRCNRFNGVPEIMEKDKCDDMNWFNWNDLPDNLFIPCLNYMKYIYPLKYL